MARRSLDARKTATKTSNSQGEKSIYQRFPTINTIAMKIIMQSFFTNTLHLQKCPKAQFPIASNVSRLEDYLRII